MSKDTMSDAELTMLSFLADVLVGAPEKYHKTLDYLYSMWLPKSKECSRILDDIDLMFGEKQPKNKEELRVIVKKLLKSPLKSEYRVGHVLKWGFGEDWEDGSQD